VERCGEVHGAKLRCPERLLSPISKKKRDIGAQDLTYSVSSPLLVNIRTTKKEGKKEFRGKGRKLLLPL